MWIFCDDLKSLKKNTNSEAELTLQGHIYFSRTANCMITGHYRIRHNIYNIHVEIEVNGCIFNDTKLHNSLMQNHAE